jgi:hypothetical protein
VISRRILVLAALAAPSAALAQQGAPAPQCSGTDFVSTAIQDACQKSVDLFAFLAPQLGISISGGNAQLGQGGTLGGPGHFSLGVRANVAMGGLPNFDNVTLSSQGAQRSDFAADDQYVGLPAVEAGIGLFKGVPLGLTSVGGVDLLVSAAYLPDVREDDFSVRTTGGALKLGYGARVGLVEESATIPGLAVTYLRRDLPTVDALGRLDDDTVGVQGLSLRTTAWRIVASKRLAIVGLAVGGGQDRYDSRADVDAVVNENVIGFPIRAQIAPVRVEQKLTRTNYFADLSLNLPGFKLVGEIGRTTGGTVAPTFNSFGAHTAGEDYTYGSIGLRFGR